MKRVVSFFLITLAVGVIVTAQGQHKIDDARMQRDIEVAENVLGTLLRQQLGPRNYFPVQVRGTYMPGYGVTFRLPNDGPMIYTVTGDNMSWSTMPPSPVAPKIATGGQVYISRSDDYEDEHAEDCDNCPKSSRNYKKRESRNENRDSSANAYNQKMIAASKDFIADYGDLISQLTPDEKITITNRNEGGNRFWYAGNSHSRKLISLDAALGDITQFKQGKLSRTQMMAKINVVNSETTEDMSPDLELLSSIFNRLYRSDLSRTYYIQENLYYERLKDFGVIYYMQVYSSNEEDYKKFSLPTVGMDNVDKATRDKKVTELYPAFEKDIKESLLDYGRTLKSLKDNERLMFNIRMTKCAGCGIPSTLELSVTFSVLKDYSSGKLAKDAALAQISVKKGTAQ